MGLVTKKEQRMSSFHNPVVRVILLILTICSGLAFSQLPYVDDVPYYEPLEEYVAAYTVFQISEENNYGQIEEDAFVITPGEGEKRFSTEVSLSEGDLFQLFFSVENYTEESSLLTVELCGPGYDLSGMETTLEIKPGKQAYSVILPYYRAYRPTTCELRISTSNNTSFRLTDLNIIRQKVVVGGNALVKAATVGAGILFGVFAVLLVFSLVLMFRGNQERKKSTFPRLEVLMYVGITGIVLVTLLILYRNIDINYPLAFSGDAVGVHYYGKLIDEYGISLVGHRTGGLSGADMYDYPYSDTLSFLLVKLISLFTDNPYLIINQFYFSCFFLTAYISTACMRYLKVGRFPAMALSILYAFSPYIQQRYGHMWLVPYFLMPIACVIAIDIMRDILHTQISTEKQKAHFAKIFFLAFCCAFTGLYYAFFACAIIAVGMVILWLNRPAKGVRQYLYPLGYLAAVLTGVVTNVIPNVVYHVIHGANSAGDLQLRNPGEAEIYGLKLVQLLLPQKSHRISALANLQTEYAKWHPLVNENSLSSIGLIASIGLVISLVFLFCRKREKDISYLNIAMILLGTVGGISSVLTVFFDIPIRCYNRLSVVIMFLSLLQIAILLDAVWKRMVTGKRLKKFTGVLLCVGVLIVGLYDQTFTYQSVNASVSYLKELGDTMKEIEAVMPEGAYIFQFPFSPWPTGNAYRNFYNYIESDQLHWSYGAMQGREESEWQKHIATWDIDSMVRQLREAGYSGLCIDTITFYETFNQMPEEYVEQVTDFLGAPVVEKENGYGTIYCWKL